MTLAQQYHAAGRQEGRQEAIINILDARFGQIPQGLRETILKIHDVGRLQALIRSAATASDLEAFSVQL